MIGSLGFLTLAIGMAGGAPADLPFEQRIRDLAAASPRVVDLAEFGQSRHGRPLYVLRLADGEGAADRPALLIVAGANSVHRVGTDVAVGLAERLAADRPDALKNTTVYIVPCLNPDGLEWQLDKAHSAAEFGRTLVPHDADRDGRVSEDPGEDLNGDGMITLMRIKEPRPGSSLRAEYTPDPENPGLLKKPDAAKGERATYTLLTEGIDNDGDGKFNEDGIGGSAGGGIDLEMNFPGRWPEFTEGAGRYALCEPEARALARWMLDRASIAAVLVYGPGDTLVTIPPAGRFDITGQVPTGIEEGDKAAYEAVSKLFKDATGMTGAPTSDMNGTLQAWAYTNYGVLSFQTPVWVRPDLVKKEAAKEGEAKEDEKKEDGKAPEPVPAAPAGPGQPEAARAGGPPGGGPPGGGPPGGGRGGFRRGGGRPGGAGGPGGGGPPAGKQPGEPGGDDAKWLKYNAERVGGGAATGFVEWKTFDHPQLGEVEIGGFVPGFRHNPPEGELPRLVGEQSGFVVGLLGKLPRVYTEAPSVERVGPGLWRVSVRATNEGALPTMAAIGVKSRRPMPTLLVLDEPLERIVSGTKFNRTWSLAGSGGSAEAQWLITGDEGATVHIRVRPTTGAEQAIEVKLQENGR